MFILANTSHGSFSRNVRVRASSECNSVRFIVIVRGLFIHIFVVQWVQSFHMLLFTCPFLLVEPYPWLIVTSDAC